MKRAVYYPCKYVPLELLAGFGAGCWPCTDEPATFEVAERIAHPNLCGYGKGLLAQAMSGKIDALVLTTCCDVMRRVYDILKAEDCIEFLYLLDLPHRRGPADVARFRHSLEDLARSYEAWSGETFNLDLALASCVPPVPRVDERITLLGAHAPLSLADTCMQTMHTHVQNLTCTGHERQVASPPPELKRAPRGTTANCNHCDVVGGAGDSSGDSANAFADNDLSRFLDWYAEALLNQLPCTRMATTNERAQLFGQQGQRGVIYHTMKFCDYYGLEYAQVSRETNLPMLKVETDGTPQSAGQIATRLVAFDETLGTAPTTAQGSSHKETHIGTENPIESKAMYVLGLDSGSTSTDVVIMNGEKEIVATSIVSTGAKASLAAQRALEIALENAGISQDELAYKVATGYGRNAIEGMNSAITEITCHARGARFLAPEVRTIIDIGGQDSKVIHLKADGSVANFIMNDKCAAGTGRFLEVTARALELTLPEFCQIGLEWKYPVQISSMCTVFAESEVVSLVAQDTPVADIVHGLYMSVASKTTALAKRVNAEAPYLMTGGVAQNEGVVRALEQTLETPIATHANSQLCGAIGAALYALDALQN